MKTPHKHADVIKAWADGAEIELRFHEGEQWTHCKTPQWNVNATYRIKPDPKPDTARILSVHLNALGEIDCKRWSDQKVKLIFDGETGKLKSAEVI